MSAQPNEQSLESVLGPQPQSLESVLGPKPDHTFVPPSLPQGVVDWAAKEGSFYTDPVKQGFALLHKAKQDFSQSEAHPKAGIDFKGARSVGEALLGAMNIVGSPFIGSIETLLGEPTRQILARVGPHVGASKGQIKDFGQFWDTVYQVGLLGDSGDLPSEATQDQKVAKAALARTPAEVVKHAKTLDNGFNEMAAKEPAKVAEVANHVESVSPEMAKYLRDKIQPFLQQSDEALTGKSNESSPRMTIKFPVQKELSPTDQSLSSPTLEEPSAVAPPSAARASEALLNFHTQSPVAANFNAQEPHPAYGGPGRVPASSDNMLKMQFALDGFNTDLTAIGNQPLLQKYFKASIEGETFPFEEILDDMTSLALKKSPEARLLSKIKQHIQPNGRVYFVNDLVHNEEPVNGLYTSEKNQIALNFNPARNLHGQLIVENHLIPTIFHEFVHAVTSNYLWKNPNSQLAKELRDLLAVARQRAMNMYGRDPVVSIIKDYRSGKLPTVRDARRLYGLTNEHEFLAEIFSSQDFRSILEESEKVAKPHLEKLNPSTTKSIIAQTRASISKWLGLTTPESKLVLHSMDVGRRIMEQGSKLSNNAEAAFKSVGGSTDVPKKSGSEDYDVIDTHIKEPWGRTVKSTGTIGMSRKAAQRYADRLNKNYGGERYSIRSYRESIRVPKGQRGSIDPKAFTEPVQALAQHLQVYFEDAVRTFNPEGLGSAAKMAAASIGRELAVAAQRDTAMGKASETRSAFWNDQGETAGMDFLRQMEKGDKFKDNPELSTAAKAYQNWSQDIYARDKSAGFDYDPIENYVPHMFEKPDEVTDFLNKNHGTKWGDPSFIKDRSFDLYEEAIKAGFKPRFTNPEDLMLAREHASNIVHAQANILTTLHDQGFAQPAEKGVQPPDLFFRKWRSPTGQSYWVHSDAYQVLHNAFRTKSLWNDPRSLGKLFRGMMGIKNSIIPIKLAFTLFHPVHIATIDNAAAMSRAGEELVGGKISPEEFIQRVGSAAIYRGIIDNPRRGWRVIKAYNGTLKGPLTDADTQALLYLADGGVVPEMPPQFRSSALQKFHTAIHQQSATAIWHAPFAALDAISGPVFKSWIPALKTASYLDDVNTAIKLDPSLLEDSGKRILRFRQIAKSVDNRYGEMAYNSLFWPKWVKDIAVANTLSMGWQVGFLREYGGSAEELGKLATNPGKAGELARAGKLHKALFTTFYTTQALAYGGLLTYALSGHAPRTLLDYVDPWTGKKTPSGDDERVGTPFYTREFEMLSRHIQDEGLVGGITHLAASKSSGVLGLMHDWWTGVNSFGEEYRDPNGSPFRKVEQTLAYTFKELEPISLASIGRGDNPALSIAGFTRAPRYIEQSPLESKISYLYNRYERSKFTPYDRALYLSQLGEIRRAFDSGDTAAYEKGMAQLVKTNDLTPKDVRRLTVSFRKKESPSLYMFQKLDWHIQKQLLDSMTPKERSIYLRVANKEHLKYNQ